MDYSKRLVVDFDDTLAFTKNRSWAEAEPNRDLIIHLTNLYNDGWIIDIFTARGNISCETRKDADIKYRDQIESWLFNNHVRYNTLSFDKPLAAYYIDDKSITPEEFLKLEIVSLEGGLSGASLYSDGTHVHKTAENSLQVQQWFKSASTRLSLPTIHRVVGNTITMDYIPHNPEYFDDYTYVALGLIQESLDSMKKLPITYDYNFDSYIERITGHYDLMIGDIGKHTSDYIQSFINDALLLNENLPRTFSHGDFGIKNMLFSDNNVMYLIDPITDMFGCTKIDIAKFIASLIINKYELCKVKLAFNVLCIYNDISRKSLLPLVQCEILRVYKYHPDKDFILGIMFNAEQLL